MEYKTEFMGCRMQCVEWGENDWTGHYGKSRQKEEKSRSFMHFLINTTMTVLRSLLSPTKKMENDHPTFWRCAYTQNRNLLALMTAFDEYKTGYRMLSVPPTATRTAIFFSKPTFVTSQEMRSWGCWDSIHQNLGENWAVWTLIFVNNQGAVWLTFLCDSNDSLIN